MHCIRDLRLSKNHASRVENRGAGVREGVKTHIAFQ